MIGASLGLAGAAMQGYLRNPLAEPGLIGVSGSAALGAVLAIHTGLAAVFTLALPLAALAGAGVGVALVLLLAGPRGASITLILAGIAISSLAAAFTSLVLNLSPNPYAASEIVFWMMGSLADRSMTHVWLALPLMVLGWGALATLGRGLDALTLGEDAAAAMGIRLTALRLTLVFGTACVIGAATAVAGAIGFVGLVVPHLLRPLTGAQPSRLLWASALGGRGDGAGGGPRDTADPARARSETGGPDGHRRRAAVPAPDLQDAGGHGMTDLRVENLSVRLRGRPILTDVSLSVGPQECVGLIGPNGAGKTTLCARSSGWCRMTGTAALPPSAPTRADGPARGCRNRATSPGRSASKPSWRLAARRICGGWDR